MQRFIKMSRPKITKMTVHYLKFTAKHVTPTCYINIHLSFLTILKWHTVKPNKPNRANQSTTVKVQYLTLFHQSVIRSEEVSLVSQAGSSEGVQPSTSRYVLYTAITFSLAVRPTTLLPITVHTTPPQQREEATSSRATLLSNGARTASTAQERISVNDNNTFCFVPRHKHLTVAKQSCSSR